jgi:hypothetical protein
MFGFWGEISVKSADFTDGPMWASAPTNDPKEGFRKSGPAAIILQRAFLSFIKLVS